MAKKAARAKQGTKKGLRKRAPTKQEIRRKARAIHKRIKGKLAKKLAQTVKLQRRLEKQKVHPDEVSARVRKKLDALSQGIASEMVKYFGSTVHS